MESEGSHRQLNDGRYQLFETLGEGGMASVYRGWDRDLEVWRAVKVLLPALQQRRGIRKRFYSEAKAMAALDHTNVVRILDVGEHDGTTFIVMEMLEGGTLDDWLERNGAMPAEVAVHVMREITAGLGAAHERGLIHRDMKPANVLIDRKGRCKVTDFGIAQGIEAGGTRTGMTMGTLGFMAPEQRVDSKRVDHRADIYALGATLYTLVTDANPGDLFAADVDPTLLEGVPPALEPILRRCTQYHPDARYSDCDALLDALEAVAEELPRPPRAVMVPDPSALTEPPDSTTTSAPPTFSTAFAGTRAAVELEPPPIPRRTVWPFVAGALLLAGIAGAVGLALLPPMDARVERIAPIEPTAAPPWIPIDEDGLRPRRSEASAAGAPVEVPDPRPTPTIPAPAEPTQPIVRVPSAMVVVANAESVRVTCSDTVGTGTTAVRLRNFPAGRCAVKVGWNGTSIDGFVTIEGRREVRCAVRGTALECQ